MSLSKPTILIVDDEPFNIEIIEEYLDGAGYELVGAGDGASAWAMLEAEPERFDTVLLDRMMPNMNGMEVLERIKGHAQLSAVPVILQTAMASKQDVMDGMRAGAFYYLTKPFEEDMLRSVVRTALDDRIRYLQMREQAALSSRVLQLMNEGSFRFRTLAEARDLAALLANACPDPGRVVMGMTELLINAVEHGNLDISYAEKSALNAEGRWETEVERRLADPAYAERWACIQLHRSDNEIRFTVTDSGEGFDWERYLEMDPDRAFDTHGRGIAMSRMISFDFLEYRGRGNEVTFGVRW